MLLDVNVFAVNDVVVNIFSVNDVVVNVVLLNVVDVDVVDVNVLGVRPQGSGHGHQCYGTMVCEIICS